MRAAGGRPGVFLDRDGTIIEDRHYIANPADVVLLPGAAEAIGRLNEAGLAVVVITNQSGIARGLLTEAQYHSTRARLDELLAARGARIDASYHCPHHPDAGGPCRCRKPGTLLHERAIADLGLDVAHSTAIGDRWRDLEPAAVLGFRGIMVPSADTPPAERARAEREMTVAASLGDAVATAVRAP